MHSISSRLFGLISGCVCGADDLIDSAAIQYLGACGEAVGIIKLYLVADKIELALRNRIHLRLEGIRREQGNEQPKHQQTQSGPQVAPGCAKP